jgi:hypothetical protein
MRAIFRKQTQRSAVGKSSCFTLYGQPVDLTDVQRHLKRKGLKAEDVVFSRSATPVGLLCSTPEPASRPMSRDGSTEVQCHSYTVGTPWDISCFTLKSETRSEYEFLSSSCSHPATPVEAATELGLNFQTLSLSPPIEIQANTPRSTNIYGGVSQEACIDPRVLEIPGTYQSVTSY